MRERPRQKHRPFEKQTGRHTGREIDRITKDRTTKTKLSRLTKDRRTETDRKTVRQTDRQSYRHRLADWHLKNMVT